MFEDIGVGTSVTNASEQLASDVVRLTGVMPDKIRFFEHYPKHDSLDEIRYEWKGAVAHRASWSPVSDVEKIRNLFEI